MAWSSVGGAATLKIRREDEEQSTQVKRRSEHEGGCSSNVQMKVTPKIGSQFGANLHVEWLVDET